MISKPFAFCCAEAGGDPAICDCVTKNHGTAMFTAVCLIPNCRNRAPDAEPFCAAHRNELERLLAAATEGPWAYRPDEFDDWGVVKSPPREVGNYEPPLILRTVLAQMRDDRRLDEEALNEHRRAGTDPWEANARLVVFLRNNAPHYLSLMDEVERLREALSKANTPQWYYAEGWEERCLHSPNEVIDWLDFAPGQYVTEVATARRCESIWCAVRVTDDEDADRRYSFTEHSTEEEAREALGETHDN